MTKKALNRYDMRTMRAGDKLDNIPLVTCPACNQTAFSLGEGFVGTDWEPGTESFAHVVENLTPTSGDIIDFCDYRKTSPKARGILGRLKDILAGLRTSRAVI